MYSTVFIVMCLLCCGFISQYVYVRIPCNSSGEVCVFHVLLLTRGKFCNCIYLMVDIEIFSWKIENYVIQENCSHNYMHCIRLWTHLLYDIFITICCCTLG